MFFITYYIFPYVEAYLKRCYYFTLRKYLRLRDRSDGDDQPNSSDDSDLHYIDV